MRALQKAGTDERREMLAAEFARAQTAQLAACAELRLALRREPLDLDAVAALAERVAIQAGRLAGFARRLKSEG